MDPSLDVEPMLSSSAREELAHLAYFLDQWDKLRGRDLIGADGYATVLAEYRTRREEILRDGRVEAAIHSARWWRIRDPRTALGWAKCAIAIAPDRREAWDFAIELARLLDLHDEAIALCTEGSSRFGHLLAIRAELEHEQAELEVATPPTVAEWGPTAETGKDRSIIFLDADDVVDGMPSAAAHAASPEPRTPHGFRLSFSSIAGEFLQEHWQKLILCLAVLLIVVSSTVGAHHLLGERLIWSRAGQCVLALVYTALVAVFGYGLVRWGAERAGRIMLLTTLFVVPVNFSLAGELRLVILPSLSHMLILLMVMVVLLALVWIVATTLRMKGDGLFPLAFFALAAFDATAARGVPFAWGFSALMVSGWVFLGAVWGLNRRLGEGEPTAERRDYAYFALGLLAYAFLFFAYRSGIFVLRLIPRSPTLMSVPVMLAAIACAHTAHHLPRLERDPRRIQLLRLGGYVLAALAFALALAHPPDGGSALLRGNTLATATLGLVLFAACLAAYWQPPYLYAAFAALFVAYFGVCDIVRDVLDPVFDPLRHALGYRGRLPLPFRALHGIAFNLALVVLAFAFRGRWRDGRLALHCHYIGLPVSIAACVLASVEPKAALLCLPVYLVLYATGSWLLAQPLLVYLACGAGAGMALALARLHPGVPPEVRALAASSVGIGLWALAFALRARKAAAPYRPPLLHAALAVGAFGVARATSSMVPSLTIAPAAIATFFLVALLGVLVGLDLPRRALAYFSVVSAVAGYLLILAFLETTLAPIAVAALALALHAAGAIVDRAEGLSARLRLYREPLLNLAFVAVGGTWLLCGLGWNRYPIVAVALTLASLTLIASTRPYPWRLTAYAAVAGLLGVWLCLFELTLGGVFATRIGLALIAGFATALPPLAEILRVAARDHDPKQRVRARVFSVALPDCALALGLTGSALALLELRLDIPLSVVLGLSALTLLWLTRFRGERALVYVGLGHAVLAALCWCGWVQTWTDQGAGAGWLAVAMGILALVLWCVAVVSRRLGAEDFYAVPCFHVALLLSVCLFGLAIPARVFSAAAFVPSLTALLLNVLVLLLLTTVWRLAALTYGAVISLVAATYVTVFSVGHATPDSTFVLGLVAVAEGLVLWTVGTLCSAAGRDAWRTVYARPLLVSTLILTVLGVPAAYNSPLTMALAGLTCVLMIHSFPQEKWLYAAIGAFACSAYFGLLAGQPNDPLMVAAVGGAYALWVAAVVLQHASPALCSRLRLQDLPYETPLFNSALIAAAVAIVLRVDLIVRFASAPTAHIWLPIALAVLALLMLKAYPSRLWIQISIALWTLSVVLGLYPVLTPPYLWLLVGMILAVTWDLLGRGLARVEEPICRRFGVGFGRYGKAVRDCSLETFGLAAPATVALVTVTSCAAAFGVSPLGRDEPSLAWWGILLALVLGALYSDWAGSNGGRGWLRFGLILVPPLVVWWAGVPASPAARALALDPVVYYPLATVAVALATVLAGVPAWTAAGTKRSWLLGPVGESRLAVLETSAWRSAAALAVLAPVFSRGLLRPATALTLLGTTAALAIVAVTRRLVSFGYAAGVAWVAAVLYAALSAALAIGLIARPAAWVSAETCALPAAYAALAAVAAALALLGVGNRCRPTSLETGSDAFGLWLARALVQVSLLSASLAMLLVASATLGAASAGDVATLTVSALFGLALFFARLASGWRTEWPVYVAQALVVGAYFDYRFAFPVSAATDALVLVLFGYVDFAIADALRRYRHELFARPTLYFSLIVPFMPLGLGFWRGALDDVTLFTVFSSAAFYSAACYWLRWKTLGYAAAVLYNAFLWIAWARVGWKLEDHPQFFLIPVGLSMILFAEANRRELGRTYVNVLRNFGLVIIYLSLAVPIWQFQSFGAWLALLLISLAGIFIGIGLQVQSFLWLGLACFCLDVIYQLGRMGMENTLAKWAIMLVLGIFLVLFVALNEKKRIVFVMRGYLEQVRQWE